jgi:hypothetical protein
MKGWPQGWIPIHCAQCDDIIGGYHRDNQPETISITHHCEGYMAGGYVTVVLK